MSEISRYDEVAFPSYPYALSHPDRLATIATLRGLSATSIQQCRVLEIGCGAGGNVLPLADTFPQSEFLAVDLSPVDIATAQQAAQDIGLRNVEFRATDVLQLDASLGPFDYILCHGVFSWTTESAREKILQLAGELLSPQGVLYLNYNTYPGWHTQAMLRDMFRFHVRHATDPKERVQQTREFIAFLEASLPPSGSPLAATVRQAVEGLRRHSDAYLFHAYLNVVNQPFYLHEVVERAAGHGLAYLGDADPQVSWPPSLSADAEQRIRDVTSHATQPVSLEEREQYYDFVRLATSRRSLFCRTGLALSDSLRASTLESMFFSAGLRSPPASSNVLPAGAREWVTRSGGNVTTAEARLQATFQTLSVVWPETRSWYWLRQEVDKHVAGTRLPIVPIETWQENLVRCFAAGIIQLHVNPATCTRTIHDRPRASRYARVQASRHEFVASLRHETVRVNEIDRRVLGMLDGQWTVEQIIAEVDPAQPDHVRQSLAELAAEGLLVAEAGEESRKD